MAASLCPPHGSGRFFQLLAREGLMLQPVGVYEKNGQFMIHIGERQTLPIPNGSPEERERRMSSFVMHAIAACLPACLRGIYQEDAHASRDDL